MAGETSEALTAALGGARGVFSIQTLDPADPMGDAEVRHARNLAHAGVERLTVLGPATFMENFARR